MKQSIDNDTHLIELHLISGFRVSLLEIKLKVSVEGENADTDYENTIIISKYKKIVNIKLPKILFFITLVSKFILFLFHQEDFAKNWKIVEFQNKTTSQNQKNCYEIIMCSRKITSLNQAIQLEISKFIVFIIAVVFDKIFILILSFVK